MIKYIIVSFTAVFSLSAFAALNCSSASFNYNAAVKQQCEQQNKLSDNAQQNFKDNFSQSLMKNQNALTITNPGTSIKPAPQPAASTQSSTTTTTTTTPTENVPSTTPTTNSTQAPATQPTNTVDPKYY